MIQPFAGIADAVHEIVETQSFKRRVILVTSAVLMLGGAAAIGVAPLAPDAALMPTTRVTESLALPDLTEQLAKLEQQELSLVREERILRGDTLGSLLQRLSVQDPDLETYIKTNRAGRSLLQMRSGRAVQVQTDNEGRVQWLHYLHTPAAEEGGKYVTRFLAIERKRQGEEFGFIASEQQVVTERRVVLRSGEIVSTLFGATDAAGIPDTIATQMAEVFGSDVDFHRGLRRGDQFRVVYESFHHDGEYVRAGRVLALEFLNNGKRHSAVWFGEAGDQGAYYTFDGKSLKKAFLRSPLEFTRITSGFAMRLHPVHQTWRQHKGVDYAAPVGTPIRSTAEGTVEFAGQQNGYGNVVILKHWGEYSTLYAHLNGFAAGLTKGAKVRQGDLIGYVGATGWATGPHLHYEVRLNNVQQDPLSIAMPDAPLLTSQRMAAFLTQTAPLHHQISLLREMRVAGGE
jgi:murein DD-endopeptidase MepM/ murein hydrolase activator NlpD